MYTLNSRFYHLCDWITRFALLHLLWIVFTALGLLFFGFFPATIAVFAIVRKWILGNKELPIVKTYLQIYKSEWLKGNLYGVLLIGIGILIYLDLIIINFSSDPFMNWMKYPLLLFIISFLLILLYAIPTYVHFQISMLSSLKNSFLIMLINPIYNIIMILGLILVYSIASVFPSLLVFFGSSLFAFIIMWSCYQSFTNVDRKKAKLKNIVNEP